MSALAGRHVKNARFFMTRRNDEALRRAKALPGHTRLVEVARKRLVGRIEQQTQSRERQGQRMPDSRVAEGAPGEGVELAAGLGLDLRQQFHESGVGDLVPALEARRHKSIGLFADQSPGRFVRLRRREADRAMAAIAVTTDPDAALEEARAAAKSF